MKVSTSKDLGAIIKDRRKSRKWTQAQLAERIGVFQKDISNCETKPEKVTIDMLIKLCAALNLEINMEKQSLNKTIAVEETGSKKRLTF